MATDTTGALLAAALKYAARGWITGPVWRILEDGRCACRQPGCKAPGKHPFKGGRGSTDPAVVRRHFADCDAGGVYIQLGKASGIIALDIDPRNGGDVTMERIELDVEILPTTATAITGGGGQHRLFEYCDVPAGDIFEFPGIDVQSNGKVIIVEPSPHASGGVYRWLRDVEPSPLPDAWVDLIRRQHAARQAKERTESTATATAVGLVAVPDAIAGGGRNVTLTRIAGRLRARGAERDAIAAELRRINAERCKPPLPDGEVDAIAKSVSRYAPGLSCDPAVVTRVQELAALVVAVHWPRIAGATQREALLRILALCEGLGKLTIGLSWRQLGELANIGDPAAKRALAAYRAAGWLRLEVPGAGNRAATYTVQRPAVLQNDPSTTSGEPPERGTSSPLCGAVLQHDAFRWGGGCGKNARPLYDVLDATPRSAAELARRAGLRRDTAHRLLTGKLFWSGLAVPDTTGGWMRGPATLDDAARRLRTRHGLPVFGRRQALIERHRRERDAWHREQRLRAAVVQLNGPTPLERAAMLGLVKRWAGFAIDAAAAVAAAHRLLDCVRAPAAPRRLALEPIGNAPPRPASSCRPLCKSASTPPPPPPGGRRRREPPRRRIPDHYSALDAIETRLTWNTDDVQAAWADAQFLHDERATEAKADLQRLRRERRALVERRRRLLDRQDRERGAA